jgi:hypothetical protein
VLSAALLPISFAPDTSLLILTQTLGYCWKADELLFPFYAFGIFLAGFQANIGGHHEIFKMFQLQSTLSSPTLY